MKTLYESLLDDEEELVSRIDSNMMIKQFLKDNYDIDGTYTIKDGVVDVKGNIIVKPNNYYITKLTNEYFKFGTVTGKFSCKERYDLKSLEGAPKKCGDFNCEICKSLINLKGAPEECEYFACDWCENLKSLVGAPKKCKMDFSFSFCDKLSSLRGLPKKCKVISAIGCKREFTEDEVMKICDAKKIYV